MLMPMIAQAWIPFVEQGKIWSYNLDASDITLGAYKNYLFELKIEGTAYIDGKDYVKCYAYFEGNLYPDGDTPYAYLREDNRTSVVYAIYNKEFPNETFPWNHLYDDMRWDLGVLDDVEGEIAVFSAFDPLVSESYMSEKFFCTNFEMERRELESSTGRQVNGWECVMTSHGYSQTYNLYEGVGYVGDMGTIYSHIGAVLPSSGKSALPILYQVTRPDGEILYFDESLKPTLSVEEISSEEDSYATEYYDMRGMPVTKDSQGVLIVKQGLQSHKILNTEN